MLVDNNIDFFLTKRVEQLMLYSKVSLVEKNKHFRKCNIFFPRIIPYACRKSQGFKTVGIKTHLKFIQTPVLQYSFFHTFL